MKWWSALLLPFAWFYGAVIVLRNLCYDAGVFPAHVVDVPVISVGNITVGGTGKTPVVEFLIRHLLNTSLRVAVVSRGYKRESRGMVVVSDGREIRVRQPQAGDEPFQMARKFPGLIVVVDEKRIRGARHACRLGAQVVILDDGFQHRGLHRDLDIVVVDGGNSPMTTRLLPAGTKREPVSALRRADVILISERVDPRPDKDSYELGHATHAPRFVLTFSPVALVNVFDGTRRNLKQLGGLKCLSISGIAQPLYFEQLLESLGLTVSQHLRYPDHYQFERVDIETIAALADTTMPDIILTTEKDAVRLSDDFARTLLGHRPLYYIEIEARLREGEEAFFDLVDRILESKMKHANRHN